jgi:hypothetical protein
MKMDAQKKIAELEQRIVALENALKYSAGMHKTYVYQTQSGLFGHHWANMWSEFELAMKEAFGR